MSTAAHACSWNNQVEVARASCEGARCPLSVPSPACALSAFLRIDLFWMKNHSRKQLFFLTPVPHLLPQTVVLCSLAAGGVCWVYKLRNFKLFFWSDILVISNFYRKFSNKPKKFENIVQWIPIYQPLYFAIFASSVFMNYFFRIIYNFSEYIYIFFWIIYNELQASWHLTPKYFIIASPENKDVIPKIRSFSNITAVPFSYIRKLTLIL